MIHQIEKEVTGGSLCFAIHGEEAWVSRARVREGYFEIPDFLNGCPVTVIEKKAFLSSKALKELVLPKTLHEAGDWAFAHCNGLLRVQMPKKNIVFGKGVFKDCNALKEILLNTATEAGEDTEVKERKADKQKGQTTEARKTAALLGAVPVKLKSEYLLNPSEAGEEGWLSMYDARLRTLLQRSDTEGYSKQVLCGEEDLMADLEAYMAEVRREKAALCYLRLVNDIGLSAELGEELARFLRENTKGCTYEASWEELLKEHGNDKEYYRIFTKSGCVTEENFEALLFDMGESNPEMKAYLMRYRDENKPAADFFDSLDLSF